MVEVTIFALVYLGVVKKEERAKDIWTVEKWPFKAISREMRSNKKTFPPSLDYKFIKGICQRFEASVCLCAYI